MTELFIKILNMSLTAGWIIIAAILFRVILKNAPKNIRFVLWALAGIRLVCPFSFESMCSMVPTAEPIPQTVIQTPMPTISNVIQHIVIQPEPTLQPVKNFSTIEIMLTTFSIIWIIGIAAMGIYAAISYIKIKRQVKISIKLKDNIYLCDNISSPFILGVIKPKIYLPSTLSENEKSCVIEHEKSHIKRLDYIWKPLGFTILSVYWFNPIIWVAYVLLCRDIELACDEKVIKKMNIEEKQQYSQALLSCSISRKSIAACPLAFGEVGVKNRIKSIINYKKPMFWVILISVIICIAVGIFFATDPMNKNENNDEDIKFNPYFNATVIETGENYVLVEPFEGYDEAKTADRIYVNLDVISTHRVPEMEVGTELRIIYNGDIKEVYPAQIDKVFAIYLLSEISDPSFEENLTNKGENLIYNHIDEDGKSVGGLTLLLDTLNKSFSLSYPLMSSLGVHGTYEETETKIICTSDDGNYKYYFNIFEDCLSFSREVPFKHPQYDANPNLTPLFDGDKFYCDTAYITQTTSYIWNPNNNFINPVIFTISSNNRTFEIVYDAYGENIIKTGTYTLTANNLTLREYTGDVLVFDRNSPKMSFKFKKYESKTDYDIPDGAAFDYLQAYTLDVISPSLEYPIIEDEDIYRESLTYVCSNYNSTAIVPPTITLYIGEENYGKFEFRYSAFSSYIPQGTFIQNNGELILRTDDGHQYFFDIVGNFSIAFNAESSSELPSYKVSENTNKTEKPFEDGALFVLDMNYEEPSLSEDNFYIDKETGTSIIKNVGGEISVLVDGDDLISDILFYENKIYYCEYYTSNLYVMDLNGENKQKLLDCDTTEGFYGGDFHSWYIYNGNLFLQSSMVLYKIDLSTYQWEIFNHDVGHYQIYNDCLYFIDHAETSFTIYKQDLKTKEIEIVLGEGVSYPKNENYSNFVIAEDGTFYITQRLPYKRLISYKDGKIEVIEDLENLEDYFDSFDELSLRYYNGYLYYVKNTDNVSMLYRYNNITKQTEEISSLDEYKRTGYVNDNSFYYYKEYLKNPQNLIQIELKNNEH